MIEAKLSWKEKTARPNATKKPIIPPAAHADTITDNGSDIRYEKPSLSTSPMVFMRPTSRVRSAIIEDKRKYIVTVPAMKMRMLAKLT